MGKGKKYSNEIEWFKDFKDFEEFDQFVDANMNADTVIENDGITIVADNEWAINEVSLLKKTVTSKSIQINKELKNFLVEIDDIAFSQNQASAKCLFDSESFIITRSNGKLGTTKFTVWGHKSSMPSKSAQVDVTIIFE